MFGNLYIKSPSNKNLYDLGKSVSSQLGIADFVERESSNYIDGHYLTVQCLGMVIKLGSTDDSDFAEYPFVLCLRADGFWIEDSSVFENIADLIARKLTLAGNIVARCPDDGSVGADILCYSVKGNSQGTARGEIEIKIIKPPL